MPGKNSRLKELASRKQLLIAESDLNDEYSRMLFRMSSPLPAHLAKFAGDKGYSITDGSRGFIFNGDPQCVVDFFEIGTRPRLVADR